MRLLVRVVVVWNFLRLVFRHRTERTNATFFRAATKQRNDKDQRPARWYWLPGYQRLLWKLAAVFGPGLVAWYWLSLTRDAAAILVMFLLIAGGNVAVYAVRTRWNERQHAADVVQPLQAAVDNILKGAA